MSFQLTYAKRAAEGISDGNTRQAIEHLCKALDEANGEVKKLYEEIKRLRAEVYSR